MKYVGSSFEYEEKHYRITDAVVTTTRIAVGWIEEGAVSSFVVTSTDGVTYRGNYGYPAPESRYIVEFRAYRAGDGEVLLLGEWWRTDSPDGGPWMIRLTPTTD